ncbi:TrpB-like pyridoxal phosphate-dependent enzyme [Bradyrhizobium jicamae]|uniref:TrpB-like pyridoxal phosphate-dependent enzyme n=1 Tax=Bradyrhizobium jicamae TaxID=280332 RepID=UPI001BA96B6E|nr:TrpB-like pyridoxal phosphate-dependent enzyme [Bradyrhizobium jicamae]MBR0934345.1 TrpB-like pyridoxal phosphate-dependent enzyme [Bradyrhizobium jicamae]
MSEAIKFILPDDKLPKHWYNILADLPQPLPPVLNAATGKPVGVEELAPLFPLELIQQEVSTERHIEIPRPILEVYRLWRPTPLRRARSLERLLGTPARIFYKDESAAPTGSFKPNEAVAEAFYIREAGAKKLVTVTGAGQWGSAIAFAGALFGLQVKVFMVRVSYEQKPYRRVLMETYGATCIPSPSKETEAGRRTLAADPTSSGSLAIAASEAIELAATDPDAQLGMGSLLNYPLLHNTVIGLEALEQMEMAGYWPDVIIGCVGGGSNFTGLAAPFLGKMLREGQKVRAIAAEPAACPSLTRGRYAYDFLDAAHMGPMAKMHTLGSSFMPSGIHAGGLRFHGMAPLVSHLKEIGIIEAVAFPQTGCFEAGIMFARCEGILPGPESNHAIRAAIDEALRCKQEGTARTILFNLSGHGNFDMQAYADYLAGKVDDRELDQKTLDAAFANLPSVRPHNVK